MGKKTPEWEKKENFICTALGRACSALKQRSVLEVASSSSRLSPWVAITLAWLVKQRGNRRAPVGAATASHLICSVRSRLLSLSVNQCVKHFIPCQLPRKSIVLPSFTGSLYNQGTGEQIGVGAWAPVSQDIGSDLRGWLLAHLCFWLMTADSCGRQREKGGDRLDVKKKRNWDCKNTPMMVFLVEFQFQIYMRWISV